MVSPIIPLAPPLQVWQVRAMWSYSGFTLSESSWSFIDVVDPADYGMDLYNLWVAHLETAYCTGRPSGWQVERITVQDRYPGTKPPLIVDYAGGLHPDSFGKGTVPQLSPVISWRTGRPGRSYRGRTFWGPIRADDLDYDGFVGPYAQAAMFAFADSMISNFGPFAPGSVPGFAIVSRQHNGLPDVPGHFTRPEYYFQVRYIKTIRARDHGPDI